MDHVDTGDVADRDQGPPERLITPNQLVGYNMTRWRQASGLTQEQLGEQLGGWTKTAVSAAERSWDGKRVRQFDADLIAALGRILGVPFDAFFMPPADEGDAFRYVVDINGTQIPAGEYFVTFVGHVIGDRTIDTPAGRAADEAFLGDLAKYRGSFAADQVNARLTGRVTDENLGNALGRVLESRSMIRRIENAVGFLQEDNALLTDLVVIMLRESEEGRARLEARDAETRRSAIANIRYPKDWRESQEQYVDLAREMFGPGHGLTDEETRRLIDEGRARGIKTTPFVIERLTDAKQEVVDPREEAEGDG